MHAVHKEVSSISKVMFDASANTASSTSLNDRLLIGPTVHPTIIDIAVHFKHHQVAFTTNVSQMYRAILLSEYQHDLHQFVWREDAQQPLKDYRVTIFTFGA